MLSINVIGGTQAERSLVVDAFDFACKELMPRKQNLDVEVTLTDIEGDADGFHLCVDTNEHEIELQQGLIEEDLATALFHEMVHVRQHCRGRLKDNGVIKVWDGVEYLSLYSTVEEYMALPWEEEAYRLQEELYTKWNTLSESH